MFLHLGTTDILTGELLIDRGGWAGVGWPVIVGCLAASLTSTH